MDRFVVAMSAAVLAACGSQDTTDEGESQRGDAAPPSFASPVAETLAAAPDLTTCPKREAVEDELRPRRDAIVVPAPLRGVARANIDNIAFATLDGATVCIDASWMDTIDNPALSADGRFASFDWHGYEAFGHVIVDRSGKGAMLDTGVEPVASPSGNLLAAADLSESGYGALSAFAVWRIEPASLRQLAKQDVVPPAYTWQIESWTGEACVELSAIPEANLTGSDDDERERYRARARNGWQIEPGRCADA